MNQENINNIKLEIDNHTVQNIGELLAKFLGYVSNLIFEML